MADQYWLPAAPFRSLARHLMNSHGLGVEELAVQAGLPVAAVRTLIQGRGGRARPRVARFVAQGLTDFFDRADQRRAA